MATITTVTGSTLPATTGEATTFYSRDTVLSETATTYAWLSTAGHGLTLTGTFTYPLGTGGDPAGSVTRAEFDLDNDGTVDLTVANLADRQITNAADFDVDDTLFTFFFGGLTPSPFLELLMR